MLFEKTVFSSFEKKVSFEKTVFFVKTKERKTLSFEKILSLKRRDSDSEKTIWGGYDW